MEELIEKDQVFPMRVRGVARVVSMTWATSTGIRKKYAGDTLTEGLTDLKEVHSPARPRGELHLKVITVVEIVALQALNDEEVDCRRQEEMGGG